MSFEKVRIQTRLEFVYKTEVSLYTKYFRPLWIVVEKAYNCGVKTPFVMV